MASRLLSDTILIFRPRPNLPVVSGGARVAARRAIALFTVLQLFLFLYLAEVSQGTTTTFDIAGMEQEYHQWQERNQELEREIAALESPQNVLRYAEAHGMMARPEAEYLIITGGQ